MMLRDDPASDCAEQHSHDWQEQLQSLHVTRTNSRAGRQSGFRRSLGGLAGARRRKRSRNQAQAVHYGRSSHLICGYPDRAVAAQMKERCVDMTTARGLISRLRELIAALDRRTLRPERNGETQIVAESAELREQARKRIAELETRKLS